MAKDTAAALAQEPLAAIKGSLPKKPSRPAEPPPAQEAADTELPTSAPLRSKAMDLKRKTQDITVQVTRLQARIGEGADITGKWASSAAFTYGLTRARQRLPRTDKRSMSESPTVCAIGGQRRVGRRIMKGSLPILEGKSADAVASSWFDDARQQLQFARSTLEHPGAGDIGQIEMLDKVMNQLTVLAELVAARPANSLTELHIKSQYL